jgi:hypothetical protein
MCEVVARACTSALVDTSCDTACAYVGVSRVCLTASFICVASSRVIAWVAAVRMPTWKSVRVVASRLMVTFCASVWWARCVTSHVSVMVVSGVHVGGVCAYSVDEEESRGGERNLAR